MTVTCDFARPAEWVEEYPQVSDLDVCPRSDSHLTYMIDIALTTEFILAVDPD